ncbi:hypothetical protein MJO28_002328 [Puccinia striiformis f. sp. tritici]|nr:hypothetical protein Pst134EA_002466 [Puccinia striiformis f. sp. tritici]KAI9617961.1 hypothetical protein KEM48_006899 [Puccinia striiformis f. sp. tritici PST-130]KAH9464051.1 hypothetical protein Pst134EB_003590 [Puccinia striiformis f. sp. tritici]KAH9471831.1 hypothetical protein Pst134EA_002466 [Puccinia striiformis f. sp. tritici]KAI7961839.1 hypothetical protein MJO28_002328 [Puccinia striiformis f. sp. tritici]KAI7966661.1 hypothetical protein MJO29_002409 [Puccinia striiformis f.
MTSHDAELSRNMDRITQLQDGIDNLVTIMYSTLSFLSRKADFKQVNPDIPITQAIPCPEGTQLPRETFTQNCEELVQDFLRKAKQIEYLISILPPHNDTTHSKLSKPPQSSSSGPIESTTQIPKSKPTSPTQQKPITLETGNQEQGPKNATDKPESNGTQDLDEDEEDSEEFERLQADVQAAQDEYDRALLEAETLHNEVKTALRQILDHRVTLLSSSSSSPCKNVNV